MIIADSNEQLKIPPRSILSKSADDLNHKYGLIGEERRRSTILGEHEPSAKSRKVNNTSTIAFMLMITTSIFNNMLMLNLGRQGTTRNEGILSYNTKADTVAILDNTWKR